MTSRNRLLIFLILGFILPFTLVAQKKGYEIDIQIKGLNDTICYLANYYGDKTYLADTAVVSKNGKCLFQGDVPLERGIYILAGQGKNKYLEFIVNDDQHFSIESNLNSLIEGAVIKGSKENDLFFGYMKYNIDNYQAISSTKRRMSSDSLPSDSLQIYREKLDSLNKLVENKRQKIIYENPKSFIALLFNAMAEPDPANDNVPDSVSPYHYYRMHYWDQVNLADDRILRTPVFHKKLDNYFTRIVPQHPDSIINEADKLIARAEGSKEVFKYIVWYMTFTYENSKIMGFDEIFVHMVDNYYSTGKAFWADSTVVKALSERADKIRPVLLGSFAPELILMDTTGGFTSLYNSVKDADFSIVMFYESDCGHCKREIDKLKNLYDSTSVNLKVFAVCTDTSLIDWKKFIIKKQMNWINVNATRSVTPDYHDLYNIYSTPTMFLLNDDKKIIAKRILTDQIAELIKNLNKQRGEVKE